MGGTCGNLRYKATQPPVPSQGAVRLGVGFCSRLDLIHRMSPMSRRGARVENDPAMPSRSSTPRCSAGSSKSVQTRRDFRGGEFFEVSFLALEILEGEA
jgi:hypothetical protein